MSLVLKSPQVAAALDAGEGVVAFETTILSFGMPSPKNQQIGEACELAAREAGAVPATAAIMNGQVRLGLNEQEIKSFCYDVEGVRKVNLQNFAAVVSSGERGALTVAASMLACSLAGIKVFATGGIGGVHRGYDRLPDISSDLVALSRYPVAVVCAGAKSILDVPATLEALETLGVPVIGFRTSTFPLFFTAQSSYQLDIVFHEISDLAAFLQTHWQLSSTGVLIVSPVPVEHEVPGALLNDWIETALADAVDAKIGGKAITPYLLKRLVDLSNGTTLRANEALIRNNARLGAEVAVGLAAAARQQS